MKNVEEYDLFKISHNVNVAFVKAGRKNGDDTLRMLFDEAVKCGASVNASLLEGGYGGKKLFREKLDDAYALTGRLKYYAILLKELGAGDGIPEEDIVTVSKMLSGLRNKIDKDAEAE